MTWADYAIASVMGLSILISLMRGFVREAFSLVTWAAAFWIGFNFAADLADLLGYFVHTPALRMILGFGILFLGTLLIGSLFNYLIGQLVDKTGLSGTDRILGALFGLIRGVLLISIVLILAKMTPMTQEPWWKESLLIPYFKPVEIWLQSLLPETVVKHLTLSY